MLAVRDRFESNYLAEPNSGCWLWMMSCDKDGYGKFLGNKIAHRISYELYVGTIPAGLVIDHLCRVRSCVNPAHLEPVTQRVNLERGVDGAFISATHCRHGHEFTPENSAIRASGVDKGKRSCRACQKASWQRYRAKKRAQRIAKATGAQ